MALMENVVVAQERLRRVELSQSGWDVARQLFDIRTGLEEKRDVLRAIANALVLLRSEGIPVPGVDVESTVSKLTVLVEKFIKEPVPGSLRTGSRWPQMIQSIDAAILAVAEARDAAWRAYVTALFSGSPPDQLSARLAKIPTNVKALKEYRLHFDRFTALKRSPPSTKDQLVQLRACSLELEKIKFQRDVPDNIKTFFDAAATSSGFELDQLTQAVMDWLKENKLIGGYIVRQRLQ
jgi:hypothetical protein